MNDVILLTVPVVNINDETALITWLCADGDAVKKEQPICEIETTKTVVEFEAQTNGILRQTVISGTRASVGARIGLIGVTQQAIEEYLEKESRSTLTGEMALSSSGERSLKITSKAAALLKQHGIQVEDVIESGVKGTVKEGDVLKYLEKRGGAVESVEQTEFGVGMHVIADLLVCEKPLAPWEHAVAEGLRASRKNLLVTTIDYELNLMQSLQVIRDYQSAGTMLSLMHILLYAVARALQSFPRLMSICANGQVYRHKRMNLGMAMKTADGRLVTPVFADVDKLTLGEICKACYSAYMQVNRGKASDYNVGVACFTVSEIPIPGVLRHEPIPNRLQSAMLAVAAPRERLNFVDGRVEAISVTTLTVSYDHTLCDGFYVAQFLALVDKLIADMEKAG